MNKRKKYAAMEVHTNDAFELKGDFPLKGRTISFNDAHLARNESNAADVDDFIQVLDSENKKVRSNSQQPIDIRQSKAQLTGIPEELNSLNRLYTSKDSDNVGLQNRTISKIEPNQGGDKKNTLSKTEIQRESSTDSVITIRDNQVATNVHTGKRFRKTSTFVISPKLSGNSRPDCMVYNNGDDTYGVRMLDKRNVPELFIEFDSLQFDEVQNEYYWAEMSRWLRYEEYYNPETQRFDSPHLSPMSIRGISTFRKLFAKGLALLDCQQEKFSDVLNNIVDSITQTGTFTATEVIEIRNALVLRHYHAGELTKHSRNTGTASYRFDEATQSFKPLTETLRSRQHSAVSFTKFDVNNVKMSQAALCGRLEPGTEALSVQVGALESLDHTFSLFVRLDPPIEADGLNEINCPLRFIFIVFGPKANEQKLLEVGRVFAVMMSNQEFREIGYSANQKEDLIEATRNFIDHSVLVPLHKAMTYETLGAMLTQMKQYANYFMVEQNQKEFDDIRKDMMNKDQELTINQYEDGVRRRMSLNPKRLSQAHLSDIRDQRDSTLQSMHIESEGEKKLTTRRLCFQFCPPLRHFIMDWRGLKTRYVGDYGDAFKRENLSIVLIGIIFIYFVVLSPAITFGALLNSVNPKMTVTLMLVASGIYQFIYTLLSGQPLEVVGITGPVFVVEKVLGSLAKDLKIDLEVMRFWIGIYVAALGLIFTIFNGVIIIKHFRRSVEEVYNFLVAVIFILSAFFSMFRALPYQMTPPIENGTNIGVIVFERMKFGVGGTTLFMSFLMANFCIILVKIKRGSFFRRQIRNLLGSFNVPLGILLIVAIERIFFQAYTMPTLNVPPSNVINISLWINTPVFENLLKVTPEAHGFCFLIGLSLFAILITEISTNSIGTTKTERKLLKPSLYSLNYFYILVIFPITSAVTGWPFVSGAMVRSNAHCLAMSKWSLNLPGVPSKVIGAVEQRVSGLLVGLLVFLSVFLGSALRNIPMAAMYGMFLYMGVMGARDLVFIRRLISIVQRRKYWGQDEFLKDYPTWNIGILISIQAFFIAILIALNCISEFTSYPWVNLIFPIFVGLYALIRGYALPRWSRLNTHLSKMDKKHPVKLFGDQQSTEQVLLTVDEKGVNMRVIRSNSDAAIALENDDDNDEDNKSVLDKYW